MKKKRERRELNRKRLEKEQEIEKKRQKRIEENGGEWEYNAEYDDYIWIGEGEPIETSMMTVPYKTGPTQNRNWRSCENRKKRS